MAQPQAGAVQDDSAVVFADIQGAADFAGLQFQHFAHHEDARAAAGQVMQASIKNAPELLLVQRILWVNPRRGATLHTPEAHVVEQLRHHFFVVVVLVVA